ncbi:hypothetical protein A8709_05220 [Paenibacillus pectinilyticus]|uniref:DNA-binding response regulator n=1 Tax=Paenibacillus pectinilyticus TaxID=512399 RepID=A0A1C0ZSN4_9BACL|nr:response regulator [Paenibacillus pectinilyticus]OCT11094.1 hypothetical protein A8709_05220 [Paenibacillus pectinilyticus]
MLQLLIVEDERTVREGLVTMIDWQSLGIEICAHVENGLKAIPFLESGKIDILLTDIRMPALDGFQLIEEVQQRQLEIACVILSGHDDFSYAQQAMRLGVIDFLIKPCSPRDIISTFQSVVQRVHDKQQFAENLTRLHDQLRLNKSMAKSHMLDKWMLAPKLPNEDRKALMEQAHVSIHHENIFIVAVLPDGKSIRELNYDSSDIEMITFAIGNIVQETLEQVLGQSVEIITRQQEVLAVCNGTTAVNCGELAKSLALIQQNLSLYLKLSVSIGVSDVKPTIDLLDEAYREAQEALQMRFFKGAGQVYFYQEVSGVPVQVPETPAQDDSAQLEQLIIHHVRTGLFAEALNIADKWLECLREPHLHSRTQINMQTYSLLTGLLHLADETSHEHHTFLEDVKSLTTDIERVETFEELSAIVSKVLQQVVKALNPNKTPKRKIQQAIEYITDHYNSPGLSLANVAKELFVSGTHLSTLFKQELGINFLDYVHQYRIEKAKAMLQTSNTKIQLIAKEVGYFDDPHFTRTFKKWVGMLPSQYKKQMVQVDL